MEPGWRGVLGEMDTCIGWLESFPLFNLKLLYIVSLLYPSTKEKVKKKKEKDCRQVHLSYDLIEEL